MCEIWLMALQQRRTHPAQGFRGRANNCISIARNKVEKALQYAYRDRRNKKRDMRALWIQRINAGSKEHGVSSPPPTCPAASLDDRGDPVKSPKLEGVCSIMNVSDARLQRCAP